MSEGKLYKSNSNEIFSFEDGHAVHIVTMPRLSIMVHMFYVYVFCFGCSVCFIKVEIGHVIEGGNIKIVCQRGAKRKEKRQFHYIICGMFNLLLIWSGV